MYNLGVEGDEAYIQQQAIAQQMQPMQEPMMMDDDDNEPSPRGEEHTPLIALLTTKLLRTSFTLKALSMALMSLFFLGFGGRWIFTFHSHPDMSNGFHLSMFVLMILYLAGTIGLALFQSFVADDSKWTKGFRTGSKILSAAVTLDLLASMLRLVQYLYLYNNLSTLWWSRFNVSKSEWTLFAVSNLLDSLSLISYGWSLFYIECYHDEGTFEELGWSMLALFTLSGIFLLLIMFTGYGAVFMLLSTAGAYAVACYWSYLFEPLLTKWSPQLHSRDINTDILPDQQQQAVTQYQQQFETSPPDYMMSQNYGQATAPNTMPAHQDIPTQYDYSHLNQQVSQGIEMGVMQGQMQ